jgi:hypothetical protein
VKGLHPIDVNGALFFLGDDTGLEHSFIDSTVQNGQTYYYAVVAYDQGFTTTTVDGAFLGIPPTETTSIIKVDINGRVKTDVNTAIVTPHAAAAGYIDPAVALLAASGPGTGTLSIDILDPGLMKGGHAYALEFQDSTAFHDNPLPWYRLVDVTSRDTVVAWTRMKASTERTPVIDGLSLRIANDPAVSINQSRTGWITGNSNYFTQVGFDSRYVDTYGSRRVNYPGDFELTITEKGQGDPSFPPSSFSDPFPTNVVIRNLTESQDHVQFILKEPNGRADSLFNDQDALFLVFGDSLGKRATDFPGARKSWSVTLIRDTTIPPAVQRAPQPGDVFRIVTRKPFRTGELFGFSARAPGFDAAKAQSDLRDVAVVPNPYVGAASWEPSTTGVGRGERRVHFIHLPRRCTIRIYTIAGHLVQTLEHDGAMDNGQEPWNLVSRDGMDVAFGVYVFHVDAPGIGTRIDRFAIMK